jgi:hypothetical protein
MTLHSHKRPRRFGSFGSGILNALSRLFFATAFIAVSAYPQSTTSSQAAPPISSSPSEALAQARINVEALFKKTSDMICTETVTQTILERDGRTAYQEHSVFTYRLVTDTSGTSLKFQESREKVEAPFHDPSRTVLLTDGFGNMLLILHPAYQASYTFEADGGEVVSGVETVRFRFRSVPNAPSPLMLQVRGQNYSVALDGTVWIEPRNGNVVKLVASSHSGMSELGVQSMNSEIQYLPAALHNPEEVEWMPASVIVDVESNSRHWRNSHYFSSYKRFPADSSTK